MNKKQWNVLGIFLILISMWFIFIDSSVWQSACYDSSFNDEPVTKIDLIACIKAEIFTPFIWITFPLGIVCFILGWLEPKKK